MDEDIIDRAAVDRFVVNNLHHIAGYLDTGVRLDIEQYNTVRKAIEKLQHVLDNQ